MCVNDFILDNREGCNKPMVEAFFNAPDQECIFSIPISKINKNDSWFWHYTRDGVYSVKSGYNLAISENTADPRPSSAVYSEWWKKYWKLHLPAKVLHFAWKGFHEALPTLAGLYKRNVSSCSNCPLCGYSNDTNGHAIFWCEGIRKVWQSLDFDILQNVIFNVSFQMVILKAYELLSKSEFELFLFTSWSIWKERNNVTHGGTSKPLSQIVSNIKRLFEEHIKAWNQRSFTNCSPCNSTSNWSNPPYGQLKLNVDAAIDESSRTIGIGAILRNSNGDIVACFSKPMFGKNS
ncbi:hypothetical protein CsatB_009577 [Cannabis sativa]